MEIERRPQGRLHEGGVICVKNGLTEGRLCAGGGGSGGGGGGGGHWWQQRVLTERDTHRTHRLTALQSHSDLSLAPLSHYDSCAAEMSFN